MTDKLVLEEYGWTFYVPINCGIDSISVEI